MKLRIGVATGPVSVGIIGMKIPKYCVFGETLNLATAMEERSQGNIFTSIYVVLGFMHTYIISVFNNETKWYPKKGLFGAPL